MLLVHLILLASQLHPEPLYNAKFVPLTGQTWLYVNDARRDLSAVGVTQSGGPGWITESSFTLIKGRPLKLPGEEGPVPSLYPEAILSNTRFIVSDQEGNVKTAIFESGKLRFVQPTKHQAAMRGLLPIGVKTIAAETPDLRPAWEGETSNLDVTWFSVQGREIGSLRYLSMVNGEFPLFNEFWTPVIKVGKKISLMQPFVKHEPGVKLGQIGFVSKEGWLVLRAWRGGEDGLAWLYPIKAS